MNANRYRLVFSKRHNAWVPTHEAATGRAGGSGSRERRRILAGVLLSAALAQPAAADLPVACGGGACGTNAAPTAFVGAGQASYSVQGNVGTVLQTTAKAILNWQSFNVGAGQMVEFIQPGAGSAALNRIWQGDASVISGQIKANGEVYLINQNGILFGKGAQVNVGGLVASSLNLADDAFLSSSGILGSDGLTPLFTFEGDSAAYQASYITIESGASITAEKGGRVMVLAPRVSNSGTISTPDGQTILAAGDKVYLTLPPDVDPASLPQDSPLRGLAGLLVEVSAPAESGTAGTVSNEALGKIVAERGNVTLVGLAVNQMGRVSATTSVGQKGSVRLLARYVPDGEEPIKILPSVDENKPDGLPQGSRGGRLVVGEGSTTEVLPELDSTATSSDDQTFNRSLVELAGKTIEIGQAAQVLAPGGYIKATARAAVGAGEDWHFLPAGRAADGSRIYVAPQARLDAGGIGARSFADWNAFVAAIGQADRQLDATEVEVSASRNYLEILLVGDELKDSPLQREGYLSRKKVWVDLRDAPPIIAKDTWARYQASIARSVAERSLSGGDITLQSLGDVVITPGASLDVSGGVLRYAAGTSHATQLYANGVAYDFATASADILYDGMSGITTQVDSKWNVTSTTDTTISGTAPTYTEGKNAGSVRINASSIYLGGTLNGGVSAGELQREKAALPTAGALILGDAKPRIDNQGTFTADYRLGSVEFVNGLASLPAGFGPEAALDETLAATAQVDLGMIHASGMGNLQIYSNKAIDLAAGLDLNLPAGGSISLTGRSVRVDGDISVPSGKIELNSRFNGGPGQYDDGTGIQVGAGAELSVRGLWVNDWLASSIPTGAVLIDGGGISMNSVSHIRLEDGSLLDASAGAWLSAGGKIKGGKGGQISLLTNQGQTTADRIDAPLTLGGALRAYGFTQGGSLKLSAPRVAIGSSAAEEGLLVLDAGFFEDGGFASFDIAGRDGLTVLPDVQVLARSENLLLDAGFADRPSGADLGAFSHTTLLPEAKRLASSLKLSADGGGIRSDLRLDSGSSLQVDAGGEIALAATGSIVVEGDIVAPAGRIDLSIIGSVSTSNDPGYDAAQKIWLGADADLLAQGALRYSDADPRLLLGEVLDGGSISLNAQEGYVVALAGSLMDVSGISATLDVDMGRQGYARKTINGDAGSIAVAAREGVYLDGELLGKAETGAAGGILSVSLSANGIYPSAINSTYPTGDRRLILSQSGLFAPAGMKADDAIAATANGLGYLAVDRVMAGGFAELSLNSEDRLEFAGNVDLSLGRAIRLNAPVISGDGSARIQAAYVRLGNNQILNNDAPALGGAGSLDVKGRLIELEGQLALQGFDDVTLTSSGDLRMLGVWNQDIGNRVLAGGLRSGADTMTLQADQIYPTSMVHYSVELLNGAGDPSGTLTVKPGDGHTPVMSALGQLTLRAGTILQNGVLKAPFGEIVLDAADSLVLGADSLISVSAEGQTISFGRTGQSGQQYYYNLGGQSVLVSDIQEKVFYGEGASEFYLSAALGKRIVLKSDAVEFGADATLDLSGGGDLSAYEWIPGLGGSSDVLDPAIAAGAFAVLPAATGEFAAYDHQDYLGVTGLKPGDQVYLSGTELTGADGKQILPAGYYTLLPARYALQPGAVLVRPVSGYTDMTAEQSVGLSNGGAVVSGYRSYLDTEGERVREARTTGFQVLPGSAVRRQAEYQDTLASQFFLEGDGQRTIDAGRLAVIATSSLGLNGNLVTDPGSLAVAAVGESARLGRGVEVDLVVENLAVVDDGAAAGTNGVINLSVVTLNRLGASSLLLGGQRRNVAGGIAVDVGSKNITLSNTGSALSAPEILLAAKENILLTSGSKIVASGDGAEARRIEIGGGGVDGDGALVRVANGGQAQIVRQGGQRDNGVLTVEGGALVGGQAVILDAAKDLLTAPDFELSASQALTLGAGRIGLGDVPAGTEGLKLDLDQLDTLSASLSSLTLQSYSTLDLYGDFSFGRDGLDLTLSAAGVAGYGQTGDTVTIKAGELTLENPAGLAFASAPGQELGLGKLVLDTNTLHLGESALDTGFASQGFVLSTLQASEGIQAVKNGKLEVAGGLILKADRLSTAAGVRYELNASGALDYLANVAAATTRGGELGGSLTLAGASVSLASRIDIPSGALTVHASQDDVVLKSGAYLDASGWLATFYDTTAAVPAGEVRLSAALGDVLIQPGSNVDVSAATDGEAGWLFLSAPTGAIDVQGTLSGQAGGSDQAAGRFYADAGNYTNLSSLFSRLDIGDFHEEVGVRQRQGDMLVAKDDTVRARHVVLSADAGDIELFGSIDAHHERGGLVLLAAGHELYLRDGAKIDAHATGSGQKGGEATLISGADAEYAKQDQANGQMVLEPGSRIDVSGTLGYQDGDINLIQGPLVGSEIGVNTFTLRQDEGVAVDLNKAGATFIFMAAAGNELGASQLVMDAQFTASQGYYFKKVVDGSLANVEGIDIQPGQDMRVVLQKDGTSWAFVVSHEPQQAGDVRLSVSLDTAGNTNLYLLDEGVLELAEGKSFIVKLDAAPNPYGTSSFKFTELRRAFHVNVVHNDIGASALKVGEIKAGDIVKLVYDGKDFVLYPEAGGDVRLIAPRIAGTGIETLYTPLTSTATTNSTLTTYTVDLSGIATTPATGTVVSFVASLTNTKPVVLKLGAASAKNLYLNGAALTSGAIQADQTVYAVYDGTQFQMVDASFARRTAAPLASTYDSKTYKLASGAALSKGMVLAFLAPSASDAQPKLQVGSQVAKEIKRGATTLQAGAIKPGDTVFVVYDGAAFQLVAEQNAPGDSGSANNYKITLSDRAALSAGDTFAFRAKSANTGQSTLEIIGAGNQSLGKLKLFNDGQILTRDAIRANELVYAYYDGQSLHLMREGDIKADVGRDIKITGVAGDFTQGVGSAIAGAGSIAVEGSWVHSPYAGEIDTSALSNQTLRYVTGSTQVIERLALDGQEGAFHFRPRLEVRGQDLRLSTDWNLGGLRYNNEPISLALRAAGDLTLAANLSDGFSSAQRADSDKNLLRGDSASLLLVAGADFTAADPLAVLSAEALNGKGNLEIGKPSGTGESVTYSGTLVRTGTGNIQVATGGDLELLHHESVIYTAGQQSPAIEDFPSGNVGPQGGNYAQFPVNGGRIEIHVGGDFERKVETGEGDDAVSNEGQISDWLRRQGRLEADGSFLSVTSASTSQPAVWSRFADFNDGIGALGGGDITLRVADDLVDGALVIPANMRLPGADEDQPDAQRLVIQGGGNADIRVGGDVLGGIFYVEQGVGNLWAGGKVDASGDGTLTRLPTIALGDAQWRLVARDGMRLSDIVNPTTLADPSTQKTYFYTYGADSGVEAMTQVGTLSINSQQTLPGTLQAVSVEGGIEVPGTLDLYPARQGQLELLAGADVAIKGMIAMSDRDPDDLPSILRPVTATSALDVVNPGLSGFNEHAEFGLHGTDGEPVRIYALSGDITGAKGNVLHLPKQARIRADGKIENLGFSVQHNQSSDITSLQSGGDIVLPLSQSNELISTNVSRFKVTGPGRLHLWAGGDIDLGSSEGISSSGNLDNPYLPEGGADVFALAGVKGGPSYAGFMEALMGLPETANLDQLKSVRTLATVYMRAETKNDALPEAEALSRFIDQVWGQPLLEFVRTREVNPALNLEQARGIYSGYDPHVQAVVGNASLFQALTIAGRVGNDADGPIFRDFSAGESLLNTLLPGWRPGSDGALPTTDYTGDIRLYFSQIKTEQDGDIDLLVPGGLINAGLAVAQGLKKQASELGVVTQRGGAIRSFVHGDLLVNQSRFFTVGGGDILLWSGAQDIDAGKGARSAGAAPSPVLVVRDGRIFFDLAPAISGSGIAAFGDSPAPYVDLIAPHGEVNAGDAGIRSSGNLNIAAVRVVNADVIQASGTSVGVPASDITSVPVGLTGTSGLNEASNSSSDITRSISSSSEEAMKANQEMKENLGRFRPSFITVEVLGFGEGTASVSDQLDEAEKNRREEERRRRG